MYVIGTAVRDCRPEIGRNDRARVPDSVLVTSRRSFCAFVTSLHALLLRYSVFVGFGVADSVTLRHGMDLNFYSDLSDGTGQPGDPEFLDPQAFNGFDAVQKVKNISRS